MPKITGDVSAAMQALGAITGMQQKVKTNNFKGSMVKYVHGRMAAEFDVTMDVMAASNPSAFHHVYEWRMTGIPAGRLWRNTLIGHGGQKVAGFKFIASRTAIPKPMERRQNRKDPISMVPSKIVESLSDRDYIFYWKAPIMEFGIPVTIKPKYGDKIFVPTGEFDDKGRAYVFTDQAYVQNPGGTDTTGTFTQAYSYWWTTQAPDIFDKEIAGTAEMALRSSVLAGMPRRRIKTVQMGVSQDAYFEVGRQKAERALEAKRVQFDRSFSSDEEGDYWD